MSESFSPSRNSPASFPPVPCIGTSKLASSERSQSHSRRGSAPAGRRGEIHGPAPRLHEFEQRRTGGEFEISRTLARRVAEAEIVCARVLVKQVRARRVQGRRNFTAHEA
jgi:hypothetical protein